MKLVYIAGPYSSRTPWGIELNIRRAEQAGFDVAAIGAAPVIPHTMYRFFDRTLTEDYWLWATKELMHRCDAIFVFEGQLGRDWTIANFKGPVFFSIGELRDYIDDH